MINAVVFVVAQHLLPDTDRCIRYCLERGYHMIGVVKDDWPSAIAMLIAGKASVIVADSPDHVPPDREPRVEYVCHAGRTRPSNAGPGISPRETRTRVIRRNAGA